MFLNETIILILALSSILVAASGDQLGTEHVVPNLAAPRGNS